MHRKMKKVVVTYWMESRDESAEDVLTLRLEAETAAVIRSEYKRGVVKHGMYARVLNNIFRELAILRGYDDGGITTVD